MTSPGRPARRARAVFSVFLIALLASLSHRSSPVSGRVLPDGKTPRPSRRAQLTEASARKVVRQAADRDDGALPRFRHRPELASPGLSANARRPVQAAPSRTETTPDYLKFFEAALLHNYLSPPL